MIYRGHYIQPVREFYDSDLIKIITGIRRSGKSVILQQIMEEIAGKPTLSSTLILRTSASRQTFRTVTR